MLKMQPSPYHLHNCETNCGKAHYQILSCEFLLESLTPWNCTHYNPYATMFMTWQRKLLHSDWQRACNPPEGVLPIRAIVTCSPKGKNFLAVLVISRALFLNCNLELDILSRRSYCFSLLLKRPINKRPSRNLKHWSKLENQKYIYYWFRINSSDKVNNFWTGHK